MWGHLAWRMAGADYGEGWDKDPSMTVRECTTQPRRELPTTRRQVAIWTFMVWQVGKRRQKGDNGHGGIGGGFAKARVRSKSSQDGKMRNVVIAASLLKKL